ncbi:MBL fold metallo-hydrolase [Phytohabitans sp. ZYX-F-186]|uniref:MBL fold metallo-hydrolase n=1 Tax=Phytohabitans maris TaxID=3071409 RepID=A0ABU0ZFB9_9ACTN|nr:MBL fold metallo-hydrolase [Phytohabitans sp. ZYX-F-186]MDQ7905756.1 MBL fold metallo-hydrolase [Phytohabitans sp. ZYX-F-186]
MSTQHESDPELVSVAEGVYAWLQPDGTWWINNAGLVVGRERALLVDTCTTERRTRRLLDAVDGVRGETPLTHAVNTHHHGDHTFGNSMLPPSTCVVGHARMREGFLADTTLETFPPFWSPRPDFGQLRRRAPDLTFESQLTVHLGGREVRLVHPGFTAHTAGDAVAWVPDVRVLFAGDLLFPGHTPMIMAGEPTGAIRSLDWMASFAADKVVPGHGPVLDAAQLGEVLADHERYYRFVLAEGKRGVAAGLTPLEVARSADLAEFRHLLDPERFVLNVHSAYGELTGTAVDRPAALADCVAWLGAPIHTKV